MYEVIGILSSMTKRVFVESTPLFTSMWIEGNAKKGEALRKLVDGSTWRAALDFEGQIIVGVWNNSTSNNEMRLRR
uniref:Uncharacterized protein n=1 Tax=Plectus sambesii TaxID=2011161 RepID=A0A914WK55_9BILA